MGILHPNWSMIYRNIERFTWAIFLFALPVTSFPFFPGAFGGEALVRPLSLFPLIFLILISIVPWLLVRPLPKSLIPLLAFFLVALASSLVSLVRGIDPSLGISILERTSRGILTLAIGIAFYLAVISQTKAIEDLHFALRWVYAGAGLALFWGSLQAVNILHFNQQWFDLLNDLQKNISLRRLFVDRVSGMTYEPNWFAEQITVLLVPWLLTAVLWNDSIFRLRWRRVTVELILLIWAVLLLAFTYSRAGIMNLVILSLAGVILFRPRKPQKSPQLVRGKPWTPGRMLVRLAYYLIEIVLILAVVSVPIYLVGSRSAFFSRIWDYWRQEETSLYDYFFYLGFDARLVYSQAAYNTYLAHPLLGVGLGNYAFYLEEALPNQPVAEIPEVLHQILPEHGRNRLVTPKNLPMRLLAETGIIGTIAFLSFVIAIFGSGLYLWLSKDRKQRVWGSASLLGLLAVILASITFDSFVIPNMWIVFGLTTSALKVVPAPGQDKFL